MIKNSTLSWLFHGPSAYTIPSIKAIDKIMNFLGKASYLFVRCSLRLLIGKKQRDRLDFCHRLYHKTNISFSFYSFLFFYKIIRFLKLGNPLLVKINVLKDRYKVYCPATEEDYLLMSEREDDVLQYFSPKKDDTVIDVGAYLGRYTFICSNRVGNNGKVIAIEANPMIFERLNKNIELNKSTNITTLNYIVYSDKPTTTKMKLFLPDESNHITTYHAGNTIMYNRYKLSRTISKEEKFVEVNANTLDNILHSTSIKEDNIKWIKIDVEGAELEVLKGAHNILSNSKDLTILIEVHHLENNKNLYEDIMQILKQYNFKLKYEKKHDSGERHIILHKQQI
jgi:FkbM family methyltransferase